MSKILIFYMRVDARARVTSPVCEEVVLISNKGEVAIETERRPDAMITRDDGLPLHTSWKLALFSHRLFGSIRKHHARNKESVSPNWIELIRDGCGVDE